MTYDGLSDDNGRGNGDLWFSINLGGAHSSQVGKLKVKLEIFKTGTNTLAQIPVKYLRLGDLDCGESFQTEGISRDSFYLQPGDDATHIAYDDTTKTIGASTAADNTNAVDVLVERLATTGSITFTYDRASDGSGGTITALAIRQFTIDYLINPENTPRTPQMELLDEGVSPQAVPLITSPEGQQFIGWTADHDVTLSNGAVIPAGVLFTSSQASQIYMDKDLILTANFQSIGETATSVSSPTGPQLGVPNSGTVTSNTSRATSTANLEALLIALLATTSFTISALSTRRPH